MELCVGAVRDDSTRERILNDWTEEIGTIWLVDGDIWMTMRFVRGQAVNSVPSRVEQGEMVVRRILYVINISVICGGIHPAR